MRKLALLVPSRGRPDNARRLLRACRDTAPDVDVYIGVDADDPLRRDYEQVGREHLTAGAIEIVPQTNRPGMVRALNILAAHCLDRYPMLAFMGDDHLPDGDWSTQVITALRQLGTGIVYGDDGIQGPLLPTAVFMTSDIVRAIGYMAPPQLDHLYVDNAWLELGRAAHCVAYLPQLTITHLHPSAGLSEWDEGYHSCNSTDTNAHDKQAFEHWRECELPASARLIRELAGQRSEVS